MREILERCVELDRSAYRAYRGLAEACQNDDLKALFERLAEDESQSVGWWTELMAAWESGLVPDIADEHDVLAELEEVRRGITTTLPEDFSGIGADDMLDAAARLEFFLLNPVFGELGGVMGPGSDTDRRAECSEHVVRLANGIERHHSSPKRATFLALMLTRADRDRQRFVALSIKDQLTGLYNRRGALNHLEKWLAWSARYVRPVSIALVDVDMFRTINETHGHTAGDDVLRHVARAIEEGARSSDIIGRFGGDEFLVLAPETGGPELSQLMDRLAERVRDSASGAIGGESQVTVSVGGAWVGGGAGVDAETIIAAADRSLHDAKEAGRDRAAEPRQAFAPATVPFGG